MLADIKYWENDAQNKHYAIAHFNVWNAEMLMGVIDAAEEANSPVIISFGTGFVGNTSFEDFSHMMVSMAKKASVPVITHWDHGRSMDIIHNAWTHGMNSLMRDASSFDFEENIRLTKEAVDFFHPLGIPVEAELGHVGNETVYEEALAGYHYTDPDQAAEFVARTGCDSLAVAIGNQHGVYTSEPKLNFEVVERVRQAVSVPLVLHGASGISDADIKKDHFAGHLENQYPHRTVSGRDGSGKRESGSAVPASGTRSTQSGKSPRAGKNQTVWFRW